MSATGTILLRQHGQRYECKYPSFFLTDNYVLHVCCWDVVHEEAAARLGLSTFDIIESGYINQHGCSFRSSGAMDRGKITAEHHLELILEVKEILSTFKV